MNEEVNKTLNWKIVSDTVIIWDGKYYEIEKGILNKIREILAR